MPVDIRRIRSADIPDVSNLLCTCYRFISGPDGYTPDQLAWILKERGSIEAVTDQLEIYEWLVACFNDLPIGIVATSRNEIEKLYVHPTHHRQGIACRLPPAA